MSSSRTKARKIRLEATDWSKVLIKPKATRSYEAALRTCIQENRNLELGNQVQKPEVSDKLRFQKIAQSRKAG